MIPPGSKTICKIIETSACILKRVITHFNWSLFVTLKLCSVFYDGIIITMADLAESSILKITNGGIAYLEKLECLFKIWSCLSLLNGYVCLKCEKKCVKLIKF